MNSHFLTKLRRNRLGLILSLVALTLILCVVTGVWLPMQWHIPTYAAAVLLASLSALNIISVYTKRITRNQSRAIQGIAKDVLHLSNELILERASYDKSLREILKRTEFMSREMEKLDSRARNDELRLRQVGQLAKAAAETSEEIKLMILSRSNDELAYSAVSGDGGELVPVASKVVSRSVDKALGRLAAAVANDPERGQKLQKALSYRTRNGTKRTVKVSVVGTDGLVRLLEEAEMSVRSLQPSSGLALLSSHAPEMLLIEERAFAFGAWFGANSSSGTQLMEELRALCDQAKRMGCAIYLISDDARPDIYSADIRKMASYKFPSADFNDHWAVGADLGILGKLEAYARQDWKL